MEHELYWARTPADLRVISKQHGDLQVIRQLSETELKSSTSKWRFRHLIVYRLLLRCSQESFLPILGPDHEEQCPVCVDSQTCSQKLNHARTKILTGNNPRNLYHVSESELMRLPEGFFWVALARAARLEHGEDEGTREYPQRERMQVEREGYVNTTSAIPGSSSPIPASSSPVPHSSDYESSMNDPDEDKHEARWNKPEEVTIHLITCLLQFALHLCLVQHPAGTKIKMEVRPRIERRNTQVLIAGKSLVTSQDDGGICQMDLSNGRWTMDNPYLALLEAKRAFKYVQFDEIKGCQVPTVSNENLAQYLGEAIVARKGNPQHLQDE